MNEFVLRRPDGDWVIEVRRSSSPLTAAQRVIAERAAFELRNGIETNAPDVLALAVRVARGLSEAVTPWFNELDESFDGGPFADDLASRLRDALRSGRLAVRVEARQSLTERREESTDVFRPPPPQREGQDTFFEVRLVDEVGQAISGVPIEFAFDGEFRDVPTNAAGVALLDSVLASSASAAVTEPSALEKVLDPRWQKARAGKRKKESNTTEVVFQGDVVGPVALKAVVPNTIVLEPPLGLLFVELFDKAGRVRLAGIEYELTGPATLSGKTDEQGRLRHERAFPGDYTLRFRLSFFEGADQQTDDYESPLVVLAADEGTPEVRMLGVVPSAVLARLQLFFNTNKTFLLPTALPSMGQLRQLYLDNNPCKLLVVGHADTAGGAAFNDQLSLERAESTIAYLKDDVDAWLASYDSGVTAKKRWGAAEDRMMLISLPDFGTKPKGEDAVRWFQRTRKLGLDGVAGPETRRQLISEYMALDGASLGELGVDIQATAHGCGEHFPLDDSGEALDAAPQDEQRDAIDRRAELFFFEPEFGIVPAPPGKNSQPGSTQYPAWRKSVLETLELRADPLDGPKATFIELIDALFRTNSAVVLPEGENPDSGDHAAFTSVGVIATALRFNAEHGGKKLLVAGHTDTTATVDFNQKLSNERAQCALAVLVGGQAQREAFKTLCDQRHTVADYKQILSWVSRAFTDLTFDCDPGQIDDNAATGVEPVRRFQKAYNANKVALGALALPLEPDGAVGPLTWGAFFDCYEFALQQELGEDADGLQALRDQLVFADDQRRALGFSEHFPIEELGVDDFKSQTNRRVEILFFDFGEEPDLAHAENDPETSEIYLPGVYQRTPLEAMLSAKPWTAVWDAVTANANTPRTMTLSAPGLPVGTPLRVTLSLGSEPVRVFEQISSASGLSLVHEDWDIPDELPPGLELAAGEPFPPAVYEFRVEGGGRSVQSKNQVTYADDAFVRLVVDPNDGDPVVVLANEPYTLLTPWGTRDGVTDGAGLLDEKALPPGGVSVLIRKRFIMTLGLLPHNWDAIQ